MIMNRNIGNNAQISPSKIMGGGALGMGKVYFVCPAASTCRTLWAKTIPSENLFLTLLAAYTACTTGQNDVIVLSPDSHALAATLTIAKNRVHIVGADIAGRFVGQRSKITFADGIAETLKAAVIVSGTGCTMTGVKIINNNTDAQVLWALSDEAEYSVYRNCSFENSGQVAVSVAGEVNLASDGVQFFDCSFGTTAYSNSGALHPCVNITSLVDGYFENCLFLRKAGATTNVFVYGAGAEVVSRSLVMKYCTFINPTNGLTMAAGVHFGAAQTSGVVLLDNCTSGGDITILRTAALGIYIAGPVPIVATTGVAVNA